MIQRAAILSTGDEIVTGKVVDTNSNYLADKLREVGVELVAVITVGDVPERLEWAWRTALDLADVVLSTGGLGPTADDLTTQTVARIAGRPLARDQATVEHIRRVFAAMNRPMPENNLRQADFPEGAEIIANPIGTAPGFHLAVGGPAARISHAVVMPGVPREMKPMTEGWVIPWLKRNRGLDTVFAVRIFQTFGISESALDEAVAGLVKPEEGRVAFRASFPQISIRITVEDRPGEAERRLESLAQRVREKISNYVFAEGDVSMEQVVGELLAARGFKLAVAESCTGGLIGHRLTNVPGSSRYLTADFVTYANQIKEGVLGVRRETLDKFGAVSEECVREMAAGARRLGRADVAIATSGIAGPDGGTPEKPVGTVCIALDAEGTVASRRYQLRGTRDWIKLLTSQIALDWLRRWTLKMPLGESMLFRR
jgi:competence/damage-inducible protein CinA-like protein